MMNIKLTASEAKPWEHCHECGYPFDGCEPVYLWESDSDESVYCSKACARSYAKRLAQNEKRVSALVDSACQAEELIPLDELERHAARERAARALLAKIGGAP